MKKLSVLISFLVISMIIFAQEDANFYKNEGNNAYREKDFNKAYESYAKALEMLEQAGTPDTALTYNAGYCAYKADKYDVAISYFTKAFEYGYKDTKPVQYLISCELKLDDMDGAIEYALKGMEVYPDDDKLKDLTATVYLKKGLVFYNEGNRIKKAANDSGLNKTDAEAFKAEYEKADEQYVLAQPIIEKAYEYSPNNDKVKQALKNVYISLDMEDKANSL